MSLGELESGQAPLGRAHKVGGGRKRVSGLNPAFRSALLALVEPDSRGDPTSPLRWTTKSTRNLAQEPVRQGHEACGDTGGDILREEGFSLQASAKTLEGTQHPDRDAQCRYLNERASPPGRRGPGDQRGHEEIELVGPFKNNGLEWQPGLPDPGTRQSRALTDLRSAAGGTPPAAAPTPTRADR